MSISKPNIVLFIADQLIPMMTRAGGHPCAITPNIDRLAREGVTFDSAYSTVPVCVPARASLLTGCHAATTGCYDNGSILPADWPTHNHYLNRCGYDTALAGKAHFIGPDQLHGFSERFMTDIYPSGFRFMPDRGADMDPRNLHLNPIAIDYTREHAGVRQYSMQMGYDEEAMLHASHFLSRRRSAMSGSGQEAPPRREDRPFFLQISLNHPHEPFHVSQRHWDLYRDAEIPLPVISPGIDRTVFDHSLQRLHGADRIEVGNPQNLHAVHRSYLASVSYVDEKLGELRAALERFGLADSTVIILLSDHGDMLGQRGMVQKRCFYEWSSRIALTIYAPSRLGLGVPGLHVAEPVSLVDVAPTILDLAGIRDALPMDGASLLPLVRGARDDHRAIFCENYSEGIDRICLMIRQGPWKYTYLHGCDERQLFNVAEDPEERDNLARRHEHRDLAHRLESTILARFDPAALETRVRESYERRRVVRASMMAPRQQTWNYRPPMDVDRMYWRDPKEPETPHA